MLNASFKTCNSSYGCKNNNNEKNVTTQKIRVISEKSFMYKLLLFGTNLTFYEHLQLQ